MLAQEGVKVRDALKAQFHIAIVVDVPQIGTCIIVAVYIPPVRQGYMAYKYADIWDGIMESAWNLQLAQQVQEDNVLILGDFNAHVGAHQGGTLSEKVALGRCHSNYIGFKLTMSQFSQCSKDMDCRGTSLTR